MNTRTKTLAALAGLALLATGCAPSLQFSGTLRYGNLMSVPNAVAATDAAKAQLLELAETYGLEVQHVSDIKMHFIARAPNYQVTQPDGAIEERIDPRLVNIRVTFGEDVGPTEGVGRHAYRYVCWVDGEEPGVFTEDDRARYALALLAVREIFEKPLSTDFLGG